MVSITPSPSTSSPTSSVSHLYTHQGWQFLRKYSKILTTFHSLGQCCHDSPRHLGCWQDRSKVITFDGSSWVLITKSSSQSLRNSYSRLNFSDPSFFSRLDRLSCVLVSWSLPSSDWRSLVATQLHNTRWLRLCASTWAPLPPVG